MTTETSLVGVTPTRSSVETVENLPYALQKKQRIHLTKFLHEDEDFVKQEFLLGDVYIGGFVFDKTSHTVKLYAMEFFEEELTSETPCVLFSAKDWSFFYNRVWSDLNGVASKTYYINEWDGATPNVRYKVTKDSKEPKPDDYVLVSTCRNKTLHEQNRLKLRKCYEEAEIRNSKYWLQSSSDSDSDNDFPIPEDYPFECCTKSLVLLWSDMPMLHSTFSLIDMFFKLSYMLSDTE